MTAVIPKISHLSSRIIRILGCNPSPMTLQGTNTYIIGTGKRRLLFDAGEANNPEYLTNLLTVLEEQNIQLQSIIISHWHSDHIGGLNDVLKKLQDGNDVRVLKYPRKEGQDDKSISSLSQFRWLKGNEEVKVEGATVKVLHTPGHTTDHVILELEEDKAIFSGDCILGEGTAVFEDLYDYMRSLQVILSRQPKVIYPGHGPVIENPVPRIEYYITHRNEREMQLAEVLKLHPTKTFNAMELVKIVYKISFIGIVLHGGHHAEIIETPEYLYPAAAKNVGQHLVKMDKEGIIECVHGKNDDGPRWKFLEIKQNL